MSSNITLEPLNNFRNLLLINSILLSRRIILTRQLDLFLTYNCYFLKYKNILFLYVYI